MEPGARIGAYVVEKHLGRGAMGEVYQVVKPDSGVRYALKLLPPELAQDPELAERFRLELLTQARLSAHPHIVGVQDVGRDAAGVPFFVMDLVEGPTWRQAMDKGQLITDGLKIAAQIGDALEAAHAAGLVHRDVKPANVLIDAAGNGRLTDFGVVALGEHSDLDDEGQMFGTAHYMPPEAANSAHAPIGPWSDVYSLGAVLYELLTGRTPLIGDSSMALMTTLVGDPDAIEHPSKHKQNVDPKLAEIAMRALKHRPEERYASAAAMAADIRAALKGDQISARQVREAAELKVWESAVPGSKPAERLVAPMATVVEDDEPGLGSFDEPELDEGRSWLEPAIYVLALVCLLGVGYATWKTFQVEEQVKVETIAWSKLDRQIRDGNWAGAISEAARLKAKFPEETPAIEERMIAVRLGQAEGAFNAENTVLARQELPDDPPEDFGPLGWIRALSGEAEAACAALDKEDDAVARLWVAAWANDLPRCKSMLATFDAERARAYAWTLVEYAPALRPEESDLGATEAPEGWAQLARGREAFARGLVSLAALDFEALHQDPGPRELALEVGLGRVGVFVARGDLEEAARALADATRHARGPIDRARCLGWATTVQLALDPMPEVLTSQLKDDPTLAAERFAPGVPRVLRSHVARELRRGDAPEEVDPRLRHRLFVERLKLRAGASSFVADEVTRCRRGEDGALGLLVVRAADRAQASYAGGSRVEAKRAEDLVQRACLLCPESPSAWIARAQLELVQHRAGAANEALERAKALAPGDPTVRYWLAVGQRAEGLAESKSVDRARALAAESPYPPEALAPLEAAVEGFEALSSTEGPVAELARRSGAEAAIELAWRQEGDAAQASFARAAKLLAPWVPTNLADLAARRPSLFTGDPEARNRAAIELAQAASAVTPQSLTALQLLALVPGEQGQAAGQAYLALAGDLPARARICLLYGQANPTSWGEALSLAESMAATHPGVRFARGLASDPFDLRGFEALLRANRERSDLLQVSLATAYHNPSRPAREDLLQALEGLEAEPGWKDALRAFVLRTEPAPEEEVDGASRERNLVHMRETSRRGVLAAHAALCAGLREPLAFALHAMLEASLGEGAAISSPPDPRVRADVLQHMFCAVAAQPRSQGIQRVAVSWSPDLVWLLDDLVAGGNTTNGRILTLGPQEGDATKALEPVAPLLQGQVNVGDVDALEAQITVLQQTGDFPAVAATLAFAVARRNLRKALPLLAGGVGGWSNRRPWLAAFASAQQTRLTAVANGGSPAGVAESALQAWIECHPLGSNWPAPARSGEMVPPVVGGTAMDWPRLAGALLPVSVELGETWWRLNEPAVYLAFVGDQLNGEASPDPQRGVGRWSRARSLLWTLSEGPSQARFVPDLARAGAWSEAVAAALRAASFHRRFPPGATLERFAKDIRNASRAHPDRANAIGPTLLLVRDAQRFEPAAGWLEAALLLDRAGLNGDDEEVARALELARSTIAADDPLERVWTLARAEVIAGEPLSFFGPLETLAQAPGARATMKTWIAHDPWKAKLEASPLGKLVTKK